MSEAPFMQLYVADYLGDTQHLTTEQHGAYFLLLLAMWRAGGYLPNDPGKLARIARVTPRRWPHMSADVMAFFLVEGQTITQKRLLSERKKVDEIGNKRAQAGRAGGKAKALKEAESGQANASDLPKHSQSSEPEPDNTTLLRAGARATIDRLYAVAGPGLADPVKEPSLTLTAAVVLSWIRDGADLEQDIVPVIQAKTANARDGPPINSWAYFAKPVAEAKARREKGLPAVEVGNGNHTGRTAGRRSIATEFALGGPGE